MVNSCIAVHRFFCDIMCGFLVTNSLSGDINAFVMLILLNLMPVPNLRWHLILNDQLKFDSL